MTHLGHTHLPVSFYISKSSQHLKLSTISISVFFLSISAYPRIRGISFKINPGKSRYLPPMYVSYLSIGLRTASIPYWSVTNYPKLRNSVISLSHKLLLYTLSAKHIYTRTKKVPKTAKKHYFWKISKLFLGSLYAL